ncbi:recombinase family protein [Larkinella arboricola]|uniref:recombinase family protein n=1 Tax=Larkinella arboricola TaxID=643671 RepID=UPI000DBA447F|nr:recombinase family protein [Larkinella arboricola]
MTLTAIARQLNEPGFRTRKGMLFRAETVKRLLTRQNWTILVISALPSASRQLAPVEGYDRIVQSMKFIGGKVAKQRAKLEAYLSSQSE